MRDKKKIYKRVDGLWAIDGNDSHVFSKKADAEAYMGVSPARKGGLMVRACGIIFVAIAAGWLASKFASNPVDPKKKEALFSCQKAIGSVSLRGDKDRPGYTNGRKIEGGWQFLWPQGSFSFQNAFGVEIPQSARCEVNASTGRISYLVVSGTAVIE